VLDARGKLTHEDYERVVPRLEIAIEKAGKLRVLIRLEDFSGWTPASLLDEVRFDVRHRNDFEKVAVVGGSRWERVATRLSAPFFSGEVRFFEREDEAEAWLEEPPPQ
jgi:hypothetical protein